MQDIPMITREGMSALLSGIGRIRAGLLGDLGLDIYWTADMTKSELSRETPHHPLPVVGERMSPGAGGNVAANMAALLPASLTVLGITGDDWRGRALLDTLAAQGVATDGIHPIGGIVTNAYCKPVRTGISSVVYEDPRLDFENHAPLPGEAEEWVIESLKRAAPSLDVLCVADQFRYGLITPAVREKLAAYHAQGLPVIVDSRERIGQYRGCILKPNELEGARAVQAAPAKTPREAVTIARRLGGMTQSEVLMTLGAQGSLYVAPGAAIEIPAHPLEGPVDFVGAGDTFLSAFGLALAAGSPAPQAAFFAGLCAEVTIGKIGTTGTASRGEVLARYEAVAG